ncbi:MAG: hypothetical protein JNM84_08140, partial [Planctomycetes bacterium]|nr:hypothetical protein [Planctomycetota bacterium]
MARFGSEILHVLLALAVAWASASAQQPEPSAGVLREAWVDPVNGDDRRGDGSVAAPYRSVTRFLNEAASVNQQLGRPVLFDADGDGDRDYVRHLDELRTEYFENVGSESVPDFVFRGEIAPRLPDFEDFAVVDVDGDGDEDLLWNQTGALNYPALMSLGLYVVLNQGGVPPRFSAPLVIPDSSGQVSIVAQPPARFACGDINNDGLWDLLYHGVVQRFSGCPNGSHLTYVLMWMRNIGTASQPRLDAPVPVPAVPGEIAHPGCERTSIALEDIDGDGYLDLLYARGHEIWWAHNILNVAFDTPQRVRPATNHGELEPCFAIRRGPRGDLWMVFAEYIGFPLATEIVNRNFYVGKFEVVSGVPARASLGELVPWTLQGEPGPPPQEVHVRLKPGTCSRATGEAFPLNCLRGVVLAGSPGSVIDSGPLDAVRGFDQREIIRRASATLPSWGTSTNDFRDIELRTQATAIYLTVHGNLFLRNVVIRGAQTGIQLSLPLSQTTNPVSRCHLEDCTFLSCGNAIATSRHSEWRELIARRCTFEQNGVALRGTDIRYHLLDRCRFVGNQVAIQADGVRTCPAGGCPWWDLLSFDILGCHFADNAEHLRLVSFSSGSTNLRAELWHDTFVGGGPVFTTAASGSEPAEVRVRSSALFAGG